MGKPYEILVLNLPMKNQSAYEKHLNPSLTMVFWFLLFASDCSNNPVWQFAGWHSYLNFPRLSKNIYAHSNLFTTKKNKKCIIGFIYKEWNKVFFIKKNNYGWVSVVSEQIKLLLGTSEFFCIFNLHFFPHLILH